MGPMRILFLVTSVTVASSLIEGIEGNCHVYDMYNSYEIHGGRYCPMEGAALSYDLTIHHCKYLCLQSTNCAAFNHDTADNNCTFLRNPFPLAHGAPGMEYFVFTAKPAY